MTTSGGFARWWQEQVTVCLHEITVLARRKEPDHLARLRVTGRLERLLTMYDQFTDKRENT